MRSAVLLVLALLLCPGSVQAWGAATHREIGEKARALLSPWLRVRAARHRRSLRRGLVAPDQHWSRGRIPSRAHVLHPGEERRGPAVDVLRELEAWLRAREPEGEEWWFQAGRLAHLVADLEQPLHTDQCPEEGRVHAPFEAWVAARRWSPPTVARGPDPGGLVARVARRAGVRRREFRPLIEGWLAGGVARDGASRAAGRWVREGILEVARAWEEVATVPPPPAPRLRGWLAAVAVWFLSLAWRLERGAVRRLEDDLVLVVSEARGSGLLGALPAS